MSDRANNLIKIAEEIVSTYEKYGGINRIDGSNLPSLPHVVEIMDEFMHILFPGYFGHRVPAQSNILFYVQSSIDNLCTGIDFETPSCQGTGSELFDSTDSFRSILNIRGSYLCPEGDEGCDDTYLEDGLLFAVDEVLGHDHMGAHNCFCNNTVSLNMGDKSLPSIQLHKALVNMKEASRRPTSNPPPPRTST